jgi:hypothetical protein
MSLEYITQYFSLSISHQELIKDYSEWFSIIFDLL